MTIADAITIASSVVGTASVLAAVLPVPPQTQLVLGVLRKVVDFLAFNWGHAANEKK